LFFASTDGLRLPRIQTYIAKNLINILIFYNSFFLYTKNEYPAQKRNTRFFAIYFYETFMKSS